MKKIILTRNLLILIIIFSLLFCFFGKVYGEITATGSTLIAQNNNSQNNNSQNNNLQNSNQQNSNSQNNNSVNSTQNASNETGNATVKPMSLDEQKKQVQEQITNANEQLQYVQGEISNKVIDIQKMQDKIAEYQAEYDTVQSQYEDLQKQVSDTENELNTAQMEYNKKYNILKDKLVVLYKQGTNSYLDILLGSGNIVDFISNYFMVETLVKHDMDSMNKVEEQKKQVEKKANELNEQKAKMKFAKNNAEKQSVMLTNTKTILESEKSSLDDSEVQILAKIDSYKKQQEEINSLINKSIINSSYGLTYTGGVMLWPTLTSSYITSPFGSRLHPIQGIVKNHDGIDIGGATGNPIYAAADGVIIYYSWMSGYGNTVMIDHGTDSEGKKIVTLYGHGNKHLDNLSVGSAVKKGDLIMEMGSTGNSTGPHVHFEVRENGTPVDPKKYLSAS